MLSAIRDHLIGNLDEETSHSLIGVVVSGDGLDHLDTVHESWEGLFDVFGSSIVEWLNESLKSLQVLDVVFGLVECLCDSKLDASPLGGRKVDLVSWSSKLFSSRRGGGCQDVIDGPAVLASQLLGDTGELSHSLLPVEELLSWASVSLVSADSVCSLEGLRDLFSPFVEDALECNDHVGVDGPCVVDVLRVILILLVERLKGDVA